jgi:phage terminase small subunit
MSELRPKQKRFVEEYLIDLNATAAARRAGYKQPNKQGPRLLVNVGISEAIQARIKLRSEKTGLTVDRIWEEWRRAALSNIADVMDFTGVDPKLKPANEISEDALRAIASMKVRRYVEGHGEDARTVEVTEFKLVDKLAALQAAAKALGMFKDRVEITGAKGGPVRMRFVEFADSPEDAGGEPPPTS